MWLIWFFSSNSRNAGVCWPLKTSKIARHGWVSSRPMAFYSDEQKDNFLCIPHHCSFIRPVVLCMPYIQLTQMETWLLDGTSPFFLVENLGRYSPARITARTTVISRLSSSGDCLSHSLSIVYPLTGTRWMAVWSQLIIRHGGMPFIITSAWISEILLFSLLKLSDR